MPTTEGLAHPTGTPPSPATTSVTVYLAGADGRPVLDARDADGRRIVGTHRPTLDESGAWSAPLAPNDTITPAGTVWAGVVTWPGGRSVTTASIPDVAGPVLWHEHLADPPGALPSAPLAQHAGLSVQDGAHGGPLDAASVGADPAGSAAAVADDLGSHEGDESAHGDPLGALGTHEGVTSAHGWQSGGSHITGPITRWAGPIHTNHDARYFWPVGMTGDATWTPNGGTRHAPANWQFPGGETTRVKWLWTPGDGWSHHTLRVGWTNAALGGVGNVVWRYYERIIAVNAGNPEGSMIETPALVGEHIATLPNAFNSNRYEDFVTHVPVSSAFHVVLSVLERHGDDEADTASGTALVYIATSTRTTGA